MRIADVIRRKGAEVFTVSPQATVAELIAELDSHRIGALVVSDDGGETVAGIVSERDVVRHLHVDGAAVLERRVADIMTEHVETCVPEDDIESLARRMTDLRVRHLPVVVDEQLRAIVSIGDVVKNRLDELQDERDQLVDYVRS